MSVASPFCLCWLVFITFLWDFLKFQLLYFNKVWGTQRVHTIAYEAVVKCFFNGHASNFMQLEFFFKWNKVIPFCSLYLAKKAAVCTSFTIVGIREVTITSFPGYLYDDAWRVSLFTDICKLSGVNFTNTVFYLTTCSLMQRTAVWKQRLVF